MSPNNSDPMALVFQYQSEARELRADNARLRAALQLSQSQNYCTLCGALNPDKDSRALENKP